MLRDEDQKKQDNDLPQDPKRICYVKACGKKDLCLRGSPAGQGKGTGAGRQGHRPGKLHDPETEEGLEEAFPGKAQAVYPAGLGDTYTYMGWALIHDWPTRQNYLRKRGGEHYDRNGFAVVDGRYVIACTTTFGKVGDYIDFVLDNGKVIHAIMGDEKNQSDAGCTRWGHDNGHSVVEFVVNKQMWYGHLGNSDITRFHPGWKSRVKMGVNLGKNFFDK